MKKSKVCKRCGHDKAAHPRIRGYVRGVWTTRCTATIFRRPPREPDYSYPCRCMKFVPLDEGE